MDLTLVLGNQLFSIHYWPEKLKKCKNIFMREDMELCTYFKFHKHKIIFFLTSMREYEIELKKQGFKVKYEKLNTGCKTFEESLIGLVKKNNIKKINFFEIEDKFFEKRIISLLSQNGIAFEIFKTPMFLVGREDFKQYLKKNKKPFMKTFYESERKRQRILVDENLNPQGGRWSFDTENRKHLPTSITPPETLFFKQSDTLKQVTKTCDEEFSLHPGKSEDFWLPTKRDQAKVWLENFIDFKLNDFGPYEDAMPSHSNFVFHSVLAPLLNIGLLTPDEVINAVIKFQSKNKVSIASVEGFVRQIIGWREFVRGIYQNFSEVQDETNFWNHTRKLSEVWYSGESSIPILKRTLKKVIKFSYCHHIERLMVLGNLMLLLGINPKEAHRWFMEMFIDSSDWVMGPNVYGMALFSDGGVFATKPYICGSNYWLKMSKEPRGDWCDGVDGLYWRFIEKNKSFFIKNPRLSMIVRNIDKMDKEKKQRIYKAADKLFKELTV